MLVKKFFGATTRDALRQVRDELGPDALILSNRQIAGGGVEIMAVADSDVATLTSIPVSDSKPGARAAHNGAQLIRSAQEPVAPPKPPASTAALARSYAVDDDDEDDEPTVADVRFAEAPQVVRSNRPAPRPEPSPQPAPPRPAPRAPRQVERAPTLQFSEPASPARGQDVAQDEALDAVAREIRMLRGLLESQIAGSAWGEMAKDAPEKLEALRQLLSAGFSPALSRQLVEKMPAHVKGEAAQRWLKAALAHNVASPRHGQDLIERGGMLALIGPTGVGKTTTVAKIAARCALAHGPDSVALLTTDSYRIGAQDQLRIYGRILNVPVHDIKDDTDLELTLADLAERHLVLIDTVGMSQRDQRIAEQLAMLSSGHIETVLLMSANAAPQTLDDVVRRYRNTHLSGCILTKLDEAMSLGGCLDVAIRQRLPLYYVTNGQRVPEDLHTARPDYLVDRAFRAPSGQGVFALKGDEFPLYMGTQEAALDFPLKFGGPNG
ncbi:flagellar biosynthesis protein FlhF [Chitinibacteraceae bacterium HSL-7]